MEEAEYVFYTGPQLQIGMLLKDDMAADVSEQTKQWMRSVGQQYEPYDRYKEKELDRLCVQWGLGGGFEWDRYRLQAGYDFSRLHGIYKAMMSFKSKELLARFDGKSDEEKEASEVYRMLTRGESVVSAERLEPVVAWAKENL